MSNLSAPNGVDQGIWTAILQWSLKHYDNTDSKKEVKPLSDDDRQFLLDVFDSMVVDENKRMKKIKNVLEISEEKDTILAGKDKISEYIASLLQKNSQRRT